VKRYRPYFSFSLRHLCVLCVSAVMWSGPGAVATGSTMAGIETRSLLLPVLTSWRRDAEVAEAAQRISN
jgi:hypothetical protein